MGGSIKAIIDNGLLDDAWAVSGAIRGLFADNGVDPTEGLFPLLPLRIGDIRQKLEAAERHAGEVS